MTRQELRVLLDEWYCGCGHPWDASAVLLRLLDLHPLYKVVDEANNRFSYQYLDDWISESGVKYLLLYMLDRWGLTEHGGNVSGGWLTVKGEEVREALRRESVDKFDALHCGGHCIHGWSIDGSDGPEGKAHRCI